MAIFKHRLQALLTKDLFPLTLPESYWKSYENYSVRCQVTRCLCTWLWLLRERVTVTLVHEDKSCDTMPQRIQSVWRGREMKIFQTCVFATSTIRNSKCIFVFPECTYDVEWGHLIVHKVDIYTPIPFFIVWSTLRRWRARGNYRCRVRCVGLLSLVVRCSASPLKAPSPKQT